MDGFDQSQHNLEGEGEDDEKVWRCIRNRGAGRVAPDDARAGLSPDRCSAWLPAAAG